MKGRIAALSAGLIFGGAGIGYAAAYIHADNGTNILVAKNTVLCLVRENAIICSRRDGKGLAGEASAGYVSVIDLKSNRTVLVCKNSTGECRKP